MDVNKGDNFLVNYLLLWVIDVGFTIFVSLLTYKTAVIQLIIIVINIVLITVLSVSFDGC